MITVETKPSPKPIVKYPYVGRNIGTDALFLFTKPDQGVLLRSFNPAYSAGDQLTQLEYNYTPCTEDVILRNQS